MRTEEAMVYCSQCGSSNPEDAGYCKHCGAPMPRPGQTVVIVRNAKSAILALILSLILPGLGQIYNGEVAKGITFLIALAISVLLKFVLIGFVLVPIVWIWAMIDAFRSAERINRGSA